MPEFNAGHGDKDAAEMDAIAVEDGTEESLIAIAPVEAFVGSFETAGLWTQQAIHCAWQPWFAAARGFTQPWALKSPLPPSDGASCSAEERSSPD